jgi:hypothetical protein
MFPKLMRGNWRNAWNQNLICNLLTYAQRMNMPVATFPARVLHPSNPFAKTTPAWDLTLVNRS